MLNSVKKSQKLSISGKHSPMRAHSKHSRNSLTKTNSPENLAATTFGARESLSGLMRDKS